MEDLCCPLTTTIFLGLITCVLLFWYHSKSYNYWKRKGIPYAKPTFLFGSMYETFWKPFHEVELERYCKLGPVYGHFEGSRPLLSIADPVLLRSVLVKDFQHMNRRRTPATGHKITDSMVSMQHGENWRRLRSIISPTFSTGKMKRMIHIFQECTRSTIQNMLSQMQMGKPIDVRKVYGCFTMDVIANSAFSTKVDSLNDPNHLLVKTARNAFGSNFGTRFLLNQLFPRLSKLLRLTFFDASSMEFFKNVTLQIIEERKRTGQTRDDFLGLLLSTSEESNKKSAEEEEQDILTNYGGGSREKEQPKAPPNKKLSNDELVAQCVIFFLAGYETTASTLSFATYLLALNPGIQDQLYEEVNGVLQKTKGEVTYEALLEMKYLDNVISESLRLYPPPIRLERIVDVDYPLGDTGITIPKGMMFTVPLYAIHRDAKYFPNPEKFDPNRFSAEERSKRDPFVYMPFGAGPRNCVAMRFALLEMKTFLAFLISTFKLKKCSQTKLEFQYGPRLLNPKEIFIELESRNTSSRSK